MEHVNGTNKRQQKCDTTEATPPKYRLHKRSGQAYVRINSKDHYLGDYGSEASQQKYKRLLNELWNAPSDDPPPRQPDASLATSINVLAVEYGKWAKADHERRGKAEWPICQNAIKEFRAVYGDLPATEFTALKFEQYRNTLIDRGLSESPIKRKEQHVYGIFAHAVKHEMIPIEVYQRLQAVGLLRMPHRKKKVMPVDLSIVRATQKELTDVVSDLVEIQLLTGMRPGEACSIRPMDIDRKGEVWTYVP